jgi:DNA-binding HxlR family transcriptional regulator
MPKRTAAERRRQAKIAYDAFLATCPSRQLLDTLSDKWVCLVLSALVTGPKRHGELARHIAGVSQKMLTQTLRSLARDGLVTRTVTPSVPVRVDYALTALGQDLQIQVGQLKRWAETHMNDILEARRRHDVAEAHWAKKASGSQ